MVSKFDYGWLCLGLILLVVGHGWGLFYAPPEREMGEVYRIIFAHVPSAWMALLCFTTTLVASLIYLFRSSFKADAVAEASAEVGVFFNVLCLLTGSIWGKPTWGVYWTWDPRLTTLLLTVLIYLAISVMRQFGGSGTAEKRFAAALGVLGTVLLPIVHFATKLWGGNHPQVITGKGDGFGDTRMGIALGLGFLAMTLLATSLLWLRARLNVARSKVDLIEERLTVEFGICGKP